MLLHVCGANRAARAVLLHERDAVAENFDPRTTPNAFVDSRAGEPFPETIADLEWSSTALYEAVETARTERPAPQRQAVWGRPIDWRLFVTHFFWDAWLHERDIVLPLGRDFATDAAETELAVAYGLLTTGVASSFVERTFVEELDLHGLGAGVFRVAVSEPGAAEVSIVDTAGSGALRGETMDVVDAIAGRHCELHEALHTSADRVRDLGMLRALLMTPG